jgi:hypothetical protein
VVLQQDRRDYHRLLHCIVAEAFVGPRPKGKEVNHKNGKRYDCRASNLEWLTPFENKNHAGQLKMGRRKLHSAQVKQIRRLKGIVPALQLATRFNIDRSYVYQLWNKCWWKRTARHHARRIRTRDKV